MFRKFDKIIAIVVVFLLGLSLVGGSSAQTLAENGEELYRQAIKNFNRGEYTESLEKFKKAIPLMTNYEYLINARKTIAVIYIAFSKQQEAVKEFAELLKLNPDMLLDPLTESPRVIEAFEQAREQLIKQGVLSPKPPPPKSPPAKAKEEAPAPLPVATAPSAPPALKPSPPVPPAVKAEERFFQQEAVPVPVIALPVETKPPVVPQPSPDVKKKDFLKQAEEYYAQQKYKLAVEELDKALYEDPGFIEAHFLLARVYNQIRGKHLMAIDEIKRVLDKQSDHVEARNLLASIYIYKTLEYEKGKGELEKVLELAPDNAQAHDLLGLVYHKSQNCSRAIDEYRSAIVSDHKLASAYNHLGDAFSQIERWSDAVFEYEVALSLEPGNFEFREDLALGYERVGHTRAATREWSRLLENNPPQAQLELAKQHLEKLKNNNEE